MCNLPDLWRDPTTVAYVERTEEADEARLCVSSNTLICASDVLVYGRSNEMIRDGTNQGHFVPVTKLPEFPPRSHFPLHNQDSAMIRHLSLTTILVAFAAVASPAFA